MNCAASAQPEGPTDWLRTATAGLAGHDHEGSRCVLGINQIAVLTNNDVPPSIAPQNCQLLTCPGFLRRHLLGGNARAISVPTTSRIFSEPR